MIPPAQQRGPQWLSQEIASLTGVTPTRIFYYDNQSTGPRLKATLPGLPEDRFSLLRLNTALKAIFGDAVSLVMYEKRNDYRVEIAGGPDELEPRFPALVPAVAPAS